MKVHLVAAARPNFMKIAPLYHQLKEEGWCTPIVIRGAQHYSDEMSGVFLQDLGLIEPHVYLAAARGTTHAEQTGNTMIAYEAVCVAERPDVIVVPGDVNATLACALVGAKLGIPVVHLEAGLRSFDRSMPEEINRIATDAIADVHWVPTKSDGLNLWNEGIPMNKITCVGNFMIDAFEMLRPQIEYEAALHFGGFKPYVVATFHRPSNVDTSARLLTICHQLGRISRDVRVIFPVHPRTRKQLQPEMLKALEAVQLEDPMPYVEFMGLVYNAQCVVTDSGGVQEETSYLGIPCVTVRENTERPVTLQLGTNRLSRIEEIEMDWDEARQVGRQKVVIPYWDGCAAERAALDLRTRFALRNQKAA